MACVLDGGACRVGLESTVVDLSGPAARLLRPGGIFATPTFSLPPSVAESEEGPEPAIAVTPGVTFPRPAVYALAMLLPAIVVVSFLLGALFGGPWIGLSHQP